MKLFKNICYEWEKIICFIEKNKPVCVELTYHQNSLRKARLIQREENLI